MLEQLFKQRDEEWLAERILTTEDLVAFNAAILERSRLASNDPVPDRWSRKAVRTDFVVGSLRTVQDGGEVTQLVVGQRAPVVLFNTTFAVNSNHMAGAPNDFNSPLPPLPTPADPSRRTNAGPVIGDLAHTARSLLAGEEDTVLFNESKIWIDSTASSRPASIATSHKDPAQVAAFRATLPILEALRWTEVYRLFQSDERVMMMLHGLPPLWINTTSKWGAVQYSWTSSGPPRGYRALAREEMQVWAFQHLIEAGYLTQDGVPAIAVRNFRGTGTNKLIFFSCHPCAINAVQHSQPVYESAIRSTVYTSLSMSHLFSSDNKEVSERAATNAAECRAFFIRRDKSRKLCASINPFRPALHRLYEDHLGPAGSDNLFQLSHGHGLIKSLCSLRALEIWSGTAIPLDDLSSVFRDLIKAFVDTQFHPNAAPSSQPPSYIHDALSNLNNGGIVHLARIEADMELHAPISEQDLALFTRAGTMSCFTERLRGFGVTEEELKGPRRWRIGSEKMSIYWSAKLVLALALRKQNWDARNFWSDYAYHSLNGSVSDARWLWSSHSLREGDLIRALMGTWIHPRKPRGSAYFMPLTHLGINITVPLYLNEVCDECRRLGETACLVDMTSMEAREKILRDFSVEDLEAALQIMLREARKNPRFVEERREILAAVETAIGDLDLERDDE